MYAKYLLTRTASITDSVRLLVIRNMRRAGDRSLEFLIMNEECLVSTGHQSSLISPLSIAYFHNFVPGK